MAEVAAAARSSSIGNICTGAAVHSVRHVGQFLPPPTRVQDAMHCLQKRWPHGTSATQRLKGPTHTGHESSDRIRSPSALSTDDDGPSSPAPAGSASVSRCAERRRFRCRSASAMLLLAPDGAARIRSPARARRQIARTTMNTTCENSFCARSTSWSVCPAATRPPTASLHHPISARTPRHTYVSITDIITTRQRSR